MSGPFNTNYVASPELGANEAGESNRRARDPRSRTQQGYRTLLAQNGLDDMPPTAPDATDEALRKRRSAALLQAGLGFGRKSTMLTQGLTDQPTLGKTMLGGY